MKRENQQSEEITWTDKDVIPTVKEIQEVLQDLESILGKDAHYLAVGYEDSDKFLRTFGKKFY